MASASHPLSQTQVDAGLRTGTALSIVAGLVGAVVLLIPLARRKLGIRTLGRVVALDSIVGVGAFAGFVAGSS